MLVVFFRGRNTDKIIKDARDAGLVPDGANTVVMCLPNDKLAQPGDVTDVTWHDTGHRRIIANGGTTRQLVPILVGLAESAISADYDYELCTEYGACGGSRSWTWDVWDVQQDKTECLSGNLGVLCQ